MQAEQDFELIQTKMEYRLEGKVDLIVYTDINQYKQSNIGAEEVFTSTKGVTKIVDNKIFVYFNGSHQDLRKQIRQGIARVFFNNMLYGDSFQEVVQNAISFNLPAWYGEGLVNFLSEDWNTDLDGSLRLFFQTNKIGDFKNFAKKYPQLAGHSMWHYLELSFGQATVSNLSYITRINKSVESAFLYVTGQTEDQIEMGWMDFYTQLYAADPGKDFPLPEAKKPPFVKGVRGVGMVTQAKPSPQGNYLVYVTNEIGKTTVWLHNFKEKTNKAIFKKGYRNNIQETDYNYPILAWTANGKKLYIFYEKKAQNKFAIYDMEEKTLEHHNMEGVERVLDVDFIDGKFAVMTAVNNGFSQLYRWSLSGGLKAITRDIYDHKEVAVVEINGQKGLVFSSNRPNEELRQEKLDSILPLGELDMFFLSLKDLEEGNAKLIRVTNSPVAKERAPMPYDNKHFAFLSDQNGIFNRYLAHIDTVFSHELRVYKFKEGDSLVLPLDSLPDITARKLDTIYLKQIFVPKAFIKPVTDYRDNILEQEEMGSNKIACLIYNQKGYVLVYEDKKDTKDIQLSETGYRKLMRTEAIKKGIRDSITNIEEAKPLELKEVFPNVKEIVPDSIQRDTLLILPSPTDSVRMTPVDSNASDKIDIDNYSFQSEYDDVEAPKPKQQVTPPNAAVMVQRDDGEIRLEAPGMTDIYGDGKPKKVKYNFSRVIPYIPKFKFNDITARVDNEVMFGFSRTNSSPNFQVPGLLVQSSIDDVMEDFRITVGLRIPFTFNGMEYFVTAENNRRRFDQALSYYRRTNSSTLSVSDGTNPQALVVGGKEITNLFEYKVRQPFDVYRSLRYRLQFRHDKFVYQPLEDMPAGLPPAILNTPIQNSQRLSLGVEYVFDNTINHKVNMWKGTRMKIYADFYNRFVVDFMDEPTFDPSSGLMGVIGTDIRHYIPIDKKTILAMRFSGATSFGNESQMYLLGGMENWLNPSFSTDIMINSKNDLQMRNNIGNLRGFANNVRNGGSFVLANAELRVPIFSYFGSSTLKGNFFRNLMITGFFDAGTAWEGISPFNEDNPLFTIIQEQYPVRVQVRYYRDPIVYGFGFGVRTLLAGYYLKFDYAWGVETGIVQKPMAYFTLGTDF